MTKDRRPYRPSNGTEGEIVFGFLCDGCRRAETCILVDLSMIYRIDEPGYPAEFVRDENGDPQCTARDVGPTTIAELEAERAERRQHQPLPADGLFGGAA